MVRTRGQRRALEVVESVKSSVLNGDNFTAVVKTEFEEEQPEDSEILDPPSNVVLPRCLGQPLPAPTPEELVKRLSQQFLRKRERLREQRRVLTIRSIRADMEESTSTAPRPRTIFEVSAFMGRGTGQVQSAITVTKTEADDTLASEQSAPAPSTSWASGTQPSANKVSIKIVKSDDGSQFVCTCCGHSFIVLREAVQHATKCKTMNASSSSDSSLERPSTAPPPRARPAASTLPPAPTIKISPIKLPGSSTSRLPSAMSRTLAKAKTLTRLRVLDDDEFRAIKQLSTSGNHSPALAKLALQQYVHRRIQVEKDDRKKRQRRINTYKAWRRIEQSTDEDYVQIKHARLTILKDPNKVAYLKIKLADSSERYFCGVCAKMFRCCGYVQMHRRKQHPDVFNQAVTDGPQQQNDTTNGKTSKVTRGKSINCGGAPTGYIPGSKPGTFVCGRCRGVFGSHAHIQQHKRMLYCSSSTPRLRCRFCAFECDRSDGLARHVQTSHSQSDHKHFPCTRCGKQFDTLNAFTNHNHSVLAGYADLIKTSSKVKSDVMNCAHLEATIKETIDCDTCANGFDDPQQLKSHMMSAHIYLLHDPDDRSHPQAN